MNHNETNRPDTQESPEMIYSQQWQQLIRQKQQNRLPHALLFTGPAQNKKKIALHFAHFLLCKETNSPCGQCHGCHLFNANSHPDFLLIEAEQAGQMIKIDQIRDLIQFVNETALQSGLRIIIIHPADAMNINAANALLKTLEEPAPHTLIILISDQSLRLPITITSRCQKIIFPTVQTEASAVTSLQVELYQGIHLLTQQKADPLQLAAQFHEQDTLSLLNWMIDWLLDQLRKNLTQGNVTFHNDKILILLDHIKKIRGHIASSLNLNKQLMLEEIFIRWSQYATG